MEYSMVVAADQAHHHDERQDVLLLEAQGDGEHVGPHELHEHVHDHAGEDERHEYAVHHVHVAAEQDGARIEPVDLQAAEQRGRHGVAGDAEREERDQRAADGGVVRRLGGDDALKLAPPVVFGMLGRPLLLIIGHHAGRVPPMPGRMRWAVPMSPER